MRSFIAIEIPDEIKKGMAEIQLRLKGQGVDASWTRPEGIHLTLKFLGEVLEAKVPEIQASLTEAAARRGGFRLEVTGVGTFPDPKNARVVWIGVSDGSGKLAALETAVEEAMAGIGFEREARKFIPHLTLGRIRYIRSPDLWLRSLDAVKDARLPAFEVRTVSLMKSELTRSGALYTNMGDSELIGC
jgi:RNA 2',3'-cyclic 3'-phosphodiesterase